MAPNEPAVPTVPAIVQPAPEPVVPTEEPRPTPAAAPSPTPMADPARLVGLAPVELAQALGRPDLTRRDGPAEVWQYTGAGCILDIFLYATEEDSGHRVAYIEVRGLVPETASPRACFTALLKQPFNPGS